MIRILDRFLITSRSELGKMVGEKCGTSIGGSGLHENDDMLPLYRDSWFTFRFAEDRIIPRCHLEGIEKGRRVSIIKIDPDTGNRQGLLATATVGDGGWVDLPEPIIVRAGEAFIAVPTTHQLALILLPDTLAVSRLDAGDAVPAWATTGQFFSITRTAEELSVICPHNLVPDGIRCERGWRCFRVAGTMDFTMIGVVASLVTPLAEAAVSVFVVSTFDTDYLLVKENDLTRAMAALRAARHEVR
jgi:hypothetical protein